MEIQRGFDVIGGGGTKPVIVVVRGGGVRGWSREREDKGLLRF